jgi:deoxyribonucleoside regulator
MSIPNAAPPTDRVLKAHVARRYYLRGATKREIGAELGISRFRVARLLEQALAEGVVRIEVDDPLPLNDEAATALRERHGLTASLVVADPAPSALARAAAAWLPQLLRPGETVAVGWGGTIAAVIEGLAPGLRLDVEVVQACGALPGSDAAGPAETAWRLAERLGGHATVLAAPAVLGPATRTALLASPALRPALERFARTSTVLVGIGALGPERRSALARALPDVEADRLAGLGAVADVLVHLVAADGTLLETGLEDHVIALPLDDLRRARVVAVAGGAAKGRAVAGALRSGLVDVLVTDEACARAVADAA